MLKTNKQKKKQQFLKWNPGTDSRYWGFPLKIENCRSQLDWEFDTKKAELKLIGTHPWPWETVRKTVNSKAFTGHHTCVFSITATNWLKNKSQPGKCKDIIGFISQFMNQAASPLATRSAP